MDILDSDIDPSLHQSLVSSDQYSTNNRPSSPADEGVLTAYDKMTPFCVRVADPSRPQPQQLSPSATSSLSFICYKSLSNISQGPLEPWMVYDPNTQIHHLVDRVKSFTSDAASRNATPFMHRYLYKDHTPSCILECFTANVLYVNRNPANMAMIMRALHRNVTDLVRTEIAHPGATVVEKLARTQALFLYQVIRLFDGDVTLRAQGEKDIPLLQSWLDELCSVRENLGNLAGMDDCVERAPPKSWEVSVMVPNDRSYIY